MHAYLGTLIEYLFLGDKMLLHGNQSEFALFEMFLERFLSGSIIVGGVEEVTQVCFGASLQFRSLFDLGADF